MELMRRPKREDELGPAMLALKERQRAFVTCLLLEPPGHGAQVNAARRAGYGTAKTKPVHMANIASRLVRHPKVLAAIVEESRKMLRTGSPEAVNALLAMIRDPNHKGHVRAVGMMLERTDPTVYHQHVTVERRQSEEEMIEFARRFAKELGVDESRLLGCNRLLPIDAEFVEVHAAPPGGTADH
jgi:phage terminase small subunit